MTCRACGKDLPTGGRVVLWGDGAYCNHSCLLKVQKPPKESE